MSLHLLRLVSPSLPVGAFSYSRGLEAAVAARMVIDETSARNWILGTLEHNYAELDGALFWRMAHALERDDSERFLSWDAWLAAGRESRELALEDRQMGEALLRLLTDLDVSLARRGPGRAVTYPAMFAIAAHHWGIAPADALMGLIWSVVEAQVAAAIRLVPLGHTSGQRILIAAVPVVERAAENAASLPDDEIGNVAPALAMASAWHETQYSRLFRS
ncbi:MAG: urease accessory protein UreF [Xanthobacteraceae bacterium]|nr:urease accessory protein UreF [Xanthobacteraceae bacterium]